MHSQRLKATFNISCNSLSLFSLAQDLELIFIYLVFVAVLRYSDNFSATSRVPFEKRAFLTSSLLVLHWEAQRTQHLMKLRSKCQQQLINYSLQHHWSTLD